MKLFNLRLFAGEGGGAPAGGEAGAGEAAAPVAPGSRKSSGELSKVLYGSQADDMEKAQAAAAKEPEVQTTSNTLEDKRKSFRDLINGEYKDVYTEETQRIIDRRFAQTKDLQKQIDDAKPVLDKLAARYNILDGDMSKLSKAIDEDSAYWTAAAEEAGVSEDVYRDMQQLRMQNAELLRMQQQQRIQAQANAQLQSWVQQADAVKQQFPGFDLEQEMQNPNFVSLLRAGTPVEHAYKVIHFDALQTAAMQTAASRTEQAVVNNIRAKGSRPAENGTSSQSTFTVKRHASQLNKADRAEAIARAMRGEIIEFK